MRATSSGAKPCARDRARPVALHEHVRAARAGARASRVRPRSSRSTNAERLPRPVSITSHSIERKRRRRDAQHVGAVRGERAAADRPRDHARQVEHAHARERPRAGAERARLARRRSARSRTSAAPRARAPAGARSTLVVSQHRHDAARGVRLALELLGVPSGERVLHGLARRPRSRAARSRARGGARSSCAGAPCRRRASGTARRSDPRATAGDLTVDAQVALAAELDRGRARVDRHGLRAPGAQPPELRGREPRGGDRRLRRGRRSGTTTAAPGRRRRDPLARARPARRPRATRAAAAPRGGVAHAARNSRPPRGTSRAGRGAPSDRPSRRSRPWRS